MHIQTLLLPTTPTPTTQQIAEDQRLLHALDFLQLELTGACNLKCVHCYTESTPLTGATDRLGGPDVTTHPSAAL